MSEASSRSETQTVIATEFGPLVIRRATAFDGEADRVPQAAPEPARLVRGRLRPRPTSPA